MIFDSKEIDKALEKVYSVNPELKDGEKKEA